ncbi:MAG: toll/interleukin-1 receptor domain-containing protein [Vicinamibacterales bacterium]
MQRHEPAQPPPLAAAPRADGGVETIWRRAAAWQRILGTWLFGHDAFLSHAHTDGKPFADQLFEQLGRARFYACLDTADFSVGSDLEKMLRLVGRAGLVVLIDTPLARQSTWVAKEIDLAVESGRGIFRVPLGASRELTRGDWPLLADESFVSLDRAISCEFCDPRQGLSATVVGELDKSLRFLSTRRRLNWTGAAILAALVLVASVLALRRLTALELRSATWQVVDPDRPLDQAVGTATAFLASPWGRLAEVLYPDEFDDAVQEILGATLIKLAPSPSTAGAGATAEGDGTGRGSYVSTDGRVRLQRVDDAPDRFSVVGPTVNGRCLIDLPPVGTDATLAQVAVANSGDRVVATRLVARNRVRVTAWRVSDCGATPLVPGRDLTIASEDIGVPPPMALNEAGDVFALAWPRHVVRVEAHEGVLAVADDWTPAPLGDERPGDVERAWLSATGKTLVARGSSWLCVTSYVGASPTRGCLDSVSAAQVTAVAVDAHDEFVLVSNVSGYLQAWEVTRLVGAAGPINPAFQRKVAALEGIVTAGPTDALVALQRTEIEHERIVVHFDAASLILIARVPFTSAPGRLSGAARHPIRERMPAHEPDLAPRMCSEALARVGGLDRSNAPVLTPARRPVLDYHAVRLLDASEDCGTLVLAGQADHRHVVEVLRRGRRWGLGDYTLVHRRYGYGPVTGARLWRDEAREEWLHVEVGLDDTAFARATPGGDGSTGKVLRYDAPLSRGAVREWLSEGLTHDMAHWSF